MGKLARGGGGVGTSSSLGLNRIMFLPWPLLQSSHGDGHLPDCVQQFAHIISELLLILSSSQLLLSQGLLLLTKNHD